MLYCLKLYWKHWNANCKHVTQKKYLIKIGCCGLCMEHFVYIFL